MDPRYKGLRWTNHALQRLRERNISQGDAWATWNRPDQSRKGSGSKDTWVYYRTFGNQKIEVVASQDEHKNWVIISVWSDTVFESKNKPFKTGAGSKNAFVRFLQILFGLPTHR